MQEEIQKMLVQLSFFIIFFKIIIASQCIERIYEAIEILKPLNFHNSDYTIILNKFIEEEIGNFLIYVFLIIKFRRISI